MASARRPRRRRVFKGLHTHTLVASAAVAAAAAAALVVFSYRRGVAFSYSTQMFYL